MNQICTPLKQHRTESSAISAVMSRGVPAEFIFRDFMGIHNSAYSKLLSRKNSVTLFDIFACGLLAALR